MFFVGHLNLQVNMKISDNLLYDFKPLFCKILHFYHQTKIRINYLLILNTFRKKQDTFASKLIKKSQKNSEKPH